MQRHIDTTRQLRLVLLRTGDRSTCFGCGTRGLRGPHKGTSRYSANPTVYLCTTCCEREAFQGDCFGVAARVMEFKNGVF